MDELPIKPTQQIQTSQEIVEQDKEEVVEEEQKFDIKKLSREIGFVDYESLALVIKNLINKTKNLEKHLSKNECEYLMLNILEEFIKHLEEQKIINSNDISVLMDHPKMITHLDGFKPFMKNYILHGIKEET